jgi:inner membrane protein
MSPITHLFTDWVFANCFDLGRKDRALVTLACVVPDVDGLGIVPELLTRNSTHPLMWFALYHHSLHNLTFAMAIALLAGAIATKKAMTFWLALVSFHVHLLEDVLGSRGPDGYQWPIPYLAPFTSRFQFIWTGQWALNAWPNVALTIALLLLLIFWLARRKGFSPIEMVSMRGDTAFVAILRRRFPTRNA